MEATENAELIANLQKQINSKNSMQFDGAKYYLDSESADKEGPFCPSCFDSSGKEIRLQYAKVQYSDHHWHCRVCKGSFK